MRSPVVFHLRIRSGTSSLNGQRDCSTKFAEEWFVSPQVRIHGFVAPEWPMDVVASAYGKSDQPDSIRELLRSCLPGHSARSRASSRHLGVCHGVADGQPLIRSLVAPSNTFAVRSGALRAWPRRTSLWSKSSERHSARDGHAATSADGHVAHDAARLASTRNQRAATARAFRSAGTASPVPKHISSGVCP